jgi:glutamyl-tRNA reductase
LPVVAGTIVALGGRWPIGVEDARRLAESRTIVVDLSSPPAVAESLQAELGDRFVSVDDLAWGEDVELQEGLRARLEQLVSDSGRAYCRWLRSRDAVPAIQAIAETAEEQRRSQLAWLLRRLPDLAEDERSLIEQMSHRLVAGILHGPRSALNADDSGDLGRAARELFRV